MDVKHKFKNILFSFISVLFVTLTIIIPIIIVNNVPKNCDYYQEKIILNLNDNSELKVSNIFDFDFDRAYVFKDSYISGEGFAEYYNIDISIDEVEATGHEYMRRIVFVDKNGDFVYNFTFRSYELNVKNEGVIIYPNTS